MADRSGTRRDEGTQESETDPSGYRVGSSVSGVRPRAGQAPVLDPDDAAFNELYRRHAAGLRNVLHRMGLDRDDLADVHSDAFLALRKEIRGGVVPPDALQRLTGIAVNLMRNQRRKKHAKKRFSWLLSGDAVLEPIPALQPDQGEQLDRERRRASVHRAIDALPEEQGALIRLIDLAEEDHDKAAASLGLTNHNLRSRLYRARQRLAELLRGSLGADPGDDS